MSVAPLYLGMQLESFRAKMADLGYIEKELISATVEKQVCECGRHQGQVQD